MLNTDNRLLTACEMVSNAAGIIHENLRKPSNASLIRARNYLDSAKRWLFYIDSLIPHNIYADKLCKAFKASSIDQEVFEIEYFEKKQVIYINGAFDLERLRQLILTV